MISDPKLPFASDNAIVEGVKSSTESTAPPDGAPVPKAPPSLLRVWLRRIAVLSFVFFCATLGVMLMILPWRPEWSDNPLLLPYPTIRAFVGNGFTRGVAMGLGVLNVWIGFWEAIQYRED